MIEKNQLMRVKNSLENHVGSRVRLVSQKGRKKSVEKQGIIKATYPSIFVIKICDEKNAENDGQMVSYSYTDVLTRAVRLALDPQEIDA